MTLEWHLVKRNAHYVSFRRGNVLVTLWRHQTLITMRSPSGETAAERNIERNTIVLPVMGYNEALAYAERLPYHFENS